MRGSLRSFSFFFSRSVFVHLRRPFGRSRLGKVCSFPYIPHGTYSRLVWQSPSFPRPNPGQDVPATSSEGAIAFRMIHEPSGQPIKYLKGIETDQGFEEIPEEEIIKGYEHTKGVTDVWIKP